MHVKLRYERMDEDKIHPLLHKQNVPQRYAVSDNSDIEEPRPW